MAYQSGLLSDFWTRYNQRRSTTGRGLTPSEMAGFLEPMLAYDAQKAIAAGERERLQSNWEREFALRQHAQEQADRAATISGIGNLAQLGGSMYLGNKYLNLLGPAKTAPLPAPAQSLASAGVANAGSVVGGAANNMLYPAMLPGQGVPAAAGGSLTAGVSGAEWGSGLTAAGAGEAGLLSTAGAVALPAVVGSMGGSLLSKPISKLLDTGPETTRKVMGVAGGAAVGFAVGGPIGGFIGAAIGGLSSLF